MNQTHLPQMIMLVAIIAVLGIRIVRMSREQRFQPARMWFIPILFAALTAWLVALEGFTTPLDVAIMLLALGIGFGIGWYQGTHTNVRVDHDAHAMFVKISPLGGLIWIGVLLLRMGVRYATGGFSNAAPGTDPRAAMTAAAHGPAALISMALLVLAVGVIFGLRAYLQRVYTAARATL